MNIKFKSAATYLKKFPQKSDWPPKLAKPKHSLASVGRHLDANRLREEKKPLKREKEAGAVALALAMTNSNANVNPSDRIKNLNRAIILF